MQDFMFYQHSHPNTRPDAVDRDLAFRIFDDLEWLNVTSLAPEGMRCCICYFNYDELVLDTDGSTVDDLPVKTPCCGQMIGWNFLVESLVSDSHCPMCRACCVAEHEHDPESDGSRRQEWTRTSLDCSMAWFAVETGV